MFSEDDALKLLEEVQLPKERIEHSKVVRDQAVELAERLLIEGISVNVELVRMGAVLHDIGRVKDEGVAQGLRGYELLKEHGVSEEIAQIACVHVGSGISKEEAPELGLPAEDFLPRTLEEKIVSYADNLTNGTNRVTYEESFEYFKKKFGFDSNQVHRLYLQHEELERFVTAEWVREVDKKSEEHGMPVVNLMDNAGRGIVDVMAKHIDLQGTRVAILCGSGNNGGDGFSAALYLKERGAIPEIFGFGIPKSHASKTYLGKAEGEGIRIVFVQDAAQLNTVRGDIILDCLLGTGIAGEIREPVRAGIEKINAVEAFKVAVDIPSGVDPDSGEVEDVAVSADLTVVLHRFKRGNVGNLLCGEMDLIDIGIPERAELDVRL